MCQYKPCSSGLFVLPIYKHIEWTFMFQTIWEYEVLGEQLSYFIQAYKSDGDWVTLFKKAKGFIHTELIQDTKRTNRFITIDKWDSIESFNNFKMQFKSEYLKMDQICEAFTISENHIGSFEVVES